ncbi:hypothetical protein Afil01_02240 [Actinorhabdospora filicis]|uniref:Uncharacterized protein n=1 Tax=Actinorhabdospora filicis TaxID=1785913 RepID=A0A9W6SG66_9ACTN|nr:hypothetical protein [Actinorhabdospora filicis]GLZ75417.1 hypothetical protein Afil01_02240 [Actinorhabdospora filicis]
MGGELVAPVEQLRQVGYELLPKAAGEAAKLTGFLAGAPNSGPGGRLAAELANAAYNVFAESADRINDSAIAVCKIANGYELTDNLNSEKMPKLGDVTEQPKVDPRTSRF